MALAIKKKTVALPSVARTGTVKVGIDIPVENESANGRGGDTVTARPRAKPGTSDKKVSHGQLLGSPWRRCARRF